MNIVELFYENKNEELAIPMAKYMKNKFPFLGIKKPEREELSRKFLKERKKDKEVTGILFLSVMICRKENFSTWQFPTWMR